MGLFRIAEGPPVRPHGGGTRRVMQFLGLCAALCSLRVAAGGDFLSGADCSHLAFFEQRGAVYRERGTPRDALQLLKSRGLNCVRLRLFTSSASQAAADPYNAINNLEYTLPLAIRAKKAGLRLLLDFHCSDTWADPGKQRKPAAWTNLTFVELERQMYDYSSNTIAAFKAADALPEYVQLGNEITSGMLWPDGRVGGTYENATQWSQLGRLLKAAARGVKDAAGASVPKILIHIDRGGDWSGTQWFFDNLRGQQVPFDIIGLSYYPFWHGSPSALSNCLVNAAERYSKPVMVVETAFPWTNSSDLYGLPASTNGQVQFVALMAKIIKSVPGTNGAGVFWWGTEYQPIGGQRLGGFEARSLFDFEGNVLPAAESLGQLTAAVRLGARTADGGVILSWPLSGAGMTLVATSNLASAVSWLPITNGIESGGPGLMLRQPLFPGALFYRLIP